MARIPPIQDIDLDVLEQDLLQLNKVRDCVRLGSFGLATPLIRARQAQMRKEVARAKRLLAEDDPEIARLEGNLERATARFALVAEETRRAEVIEPDFDPEAGVIWGRVVDDAMPQQGLSVAVEGDGVQLDFTCTDRKGGFTLKVPPETPTRLIVRGKNGAVLYSDRVETTLRSGQQIFREIDLTRGADVPCPDPSGAPIDAPESFAMVRLVGQPESTALSILRNLKLRPGKREIEPAPESLGLVLAHTPGEGETVAPGTRVDYTVGVSDQIAVPRLIGLPLEAARTRLEAVGLSFGALEQVVVTGETPGLILDQVPYANSDVARGTAVDLTIGITDPSAPRLVSVPRLVGERADRAAAILEEVGLVVGSLSEVEAASDSVGLVLDQDPKPDASVPESSAVSIFVGVAGIPATEMVRVPELVGLSADEALEKISSATLIVGTISERPVAREKVGFVLDQDPDIGVLVTPGSPVSFELGVPRSNAGRVAMPLVTGKTAEDAIAELAEIGLDVTIRDRAVRSEAQLGIVLDQVPKAGRELPVGTAVAIFVGVAAEGPRGGGTDGVMDEIIAFASAQISEDPDIMRERLFAAGVSNPDRVAEVITREPAEIRDILGLPNEPLARRYRSGLRRALAELLG